MDLMARMLEEVKFLEKEVKKVYPNRKYVIDTVQDNIGNDINYCLRIENAKSPNSYKPFYPLGDKSFSRENEKGATFTVQDVINFMSNH